MSKSIKLTGRITEKKSSKRDIEFVQKKLNQGMDQASLVREAIKYYRKFEEGTLFNDVIEERILKILQSHKNSLITSEVKGKNTSQLQNKINEKLISGDWGL